MKKDLQERLPVKSLTDEHCLSHPKELDMGWYSVNDTMSISVGSSLQPKEALSQILP